MYGDEELDGFLYTINQSIDAERITNYQNLKSYYERRLSRLQEEKKNLDKLLETQFEITDQLNIKDDELVKTAVVEVRKVDNETFNNYSSQKTDNFIKNAKEALSFEDFFQENPFAYGAFFDKNYQINTEQVSRFIQTLPTETRTSFLNTFFHDLHSIPYTLKFFHKILSVQNWLELSELIEGEFGKLLGFSRAQIYKFDNMTKSIILEKKAVKMVYKLDGGCVDKANEKNERTYFTKNHKNFKFDDSLILGKNSSAFVAPIPKISAIIILFDKIKGNITAFDDLMISETIEYIIKMNYIFVANEIRDHKENIYYKVAHAIVQLSSVADIKSMVGRFESCLKELFSCDGVMLYKIHTTRRTMERLTQNTTQNELLPTSHGIVGATIQKRRIQNICDPERSVYFHPKTDRYDPLVRSQTLLTSPIFKNKEVKYVITLVNKKCTSSFTEDDNNILEILSEVIGPIITSASKYSKMSEEVKSSTNMTHDLNELSTFITSIDHISDKDQIADAAAERLKKLIGFNVCTLYTANLKKRILYGSGKGASYFHIINRKDTDSIMCSLIRQRVAEKNKVSLYVPFYGTRLTTAGLALLETEMEAQTANMGYIVTSRTTRSGASANTSVLNLATAKFSGLTGEAVTIDFNNLMSGRTRRVLQQWRASFGAFIDAINFEIPSSFILSRLLRFANEYQSSSSQFLREFIKVLTGALASAGIEKTKINIIPKGNEAEYCDFLLSILGLPGLVLTPYHEPDANFSMPEKIFVDNSVNFDSNGTSEEMIIALLVDIAERFGIMDYLETDDNFFASFLHESRKAHSTDSFRNWKLAVDHVQFAFYFIQESDGSELLSDLEKTALFCYFVTAYADPFGTGSSDRTILMNGEMATASTNLYSLCSILSDIDAQKRNEILDNVCFLERCTDAESTISNSLMMLIAVVSRFSYLARPNAGAFIEQRFKEELMEELVYEDMNDQKIIEQMKKSILEFESRSIIQPTFSEIYRRKLTIDFVRKPIVDNLSKLTKIDL